MTTPRPRPTKAKPRGKAMPAKRKPAPPVWLLISKDGSVGETYFHPRYASRAAKEWNGNAKEARVSMGWDVVEYRPAPRRSSR